MVLWSQPDFLCPVTVTTGIHRTQVWNGFARVLTRASTDQVVRGGEIFSFPSERCTQRDLIIGAWLLWPYPAMWCKNSVQRQLIARHNVVSVCQVPQMTPDVSLVVSSLGSVHATTLPDCCLLCLHVIFLFVHALSYATQKSVGSLFY